MSLFNTRRCLNLRDENMMKYEEGKQIWKHLEPAVRLMVSRDGCVEICENIMCNFQPATLWRTTHGQPNKLGWLWKMSMTRTWGSCIKSEATNFYFLLRNWI